jgi:nuclear transcription factor Y gamma
MTSSPGDTEQPDPKRIKIETVDTPVTTQTQEVQPQAQAQVQVKPQIQPQIVQQQVQPTPIATVTQPVTATVTATPSASTAPAPAATTTTAPRATHTTAAATPATTTVRKLTPTGALQQQIQAQLQQQLQAQLQAAAARGQQANITPEQIQAQAQAMVQAAAQAQAVVSAAKSRGDGLVPMNAQQIAALSQIQAQAIVNARPQTALLASGTPTIDKDGKAVTPTPAQIQHQITLQAQALVHAHTQAQIAAGIYKGDASKPGSASAAAKPAAAPLAKPNPAPAASPLTAANTVPSSANPLLSTLTPAQLAQQNKLATRQNLTKETLSKNHSVESNNLRAGFQQQNLAMAQSAESRARQEAELKAIGAKHQAELLNMSKTFQKELGELHAEFRKQNAAAEYAGLKVATLPNPTSVPSAAVARTTVQKVGSGAPITTLSTMGEDGSVPSSTSPAFLEKLSGTLNSFWTDQLHQMRELGTTIPQTEQDFKNHNDLPLARIKRIMKSDEDVRMISAEAPVLFAKACEMFILELTLRSWSYSENNKRRTLQKEDIREAIQRTDIFDFLVDVIH